MLLKKQNNLILMFLLGTGLLQFSCKKEATPEEYLKWCRSKSSGLIQQSENNGIIIIAAYKPLELVTLLELNRQNLNKKNFEAEKSGHLDIQTFQLTVRAKDGRDILKKGNSTKNEVFERISYIFSNVQNDIKLQEGNEEFPCISSIFERDYGLSGEQRLVLAFPVTYKEKEERRTGNAGFKNDKVLVFQDNVFHSGTLKFTFKASDLNSIPRLNIN